MTFLAFKPFRRRKHRNDVLVTSYIRISQLSKLKSKDITSKTLHAKFYASRIKNKRIRRGAKYAPRVWSVFKSPGKIGLMYLSLTLYTSTSHIESVDLLLLRLYIYCCPSNSPGSQRYLTFVPTSISFSSSFLTGC